MVLKRNGAGLSEPEGNPPSNPVNIAAIDAGSNAIRLVIAHASSATEVSKIDGRRLPVRLGHRVFTEGDFDSATITQAVEAFKHFQSLMERHNVARYRAVATSACRESHNTDYLVERIKRDSGIDLEVIDPGEEVRLISLGVVQALGDRASPELIMDLGGGSLDINWMGERTVQRSRTLPIGTVRLMERLGITGTVSEEQVGLLRDYIHEVFSEHTSKNPDFANLEAVACGGNAEALAELAPGRPRGKSPTLDMYHLEEILWKILKLDVEGRVKTFGVSKDRAEVMAVAAVVFTTLGRLFRLREIMVPGVGVREGVLHDLVTGVFGEAPVTEQAQKMAVRSAARRLALRFGCEQRHIEQVCDLSLSMFDQLAPLHGLGNDHRFLLELAAILHDVGHLVGRKSHHKHGMYLVKGSDLPGLTSRELKLVATLVRYHTGAKPKQKHEFFKKLIPEEQEAVRKLASLLRISERLDSDHKQGIQDAKITTLGNQALLVLDGDLKSVHTITDAKRATSLFEEVFQLEVIFAKRQ